MSPKKEDRLNFMKNEQFHRRGFKEVRDQVEQSIEEQYQSDIVDELKSSNYVIEKDGVKVYLAKVRKKKQKKKQTNKHKRTIYEKKEKVEIFWTYLPFFVLRNRNTILCRHLTS